MFICDSAFSYQVPENGLYKIWTCAPQRPCTLAVLLPHILRFCSDVWVNPIISLQEWIFRVFAQGTLKILSCFCNAYSAQYKIWLIHLWPNLDTRVQMLLPLFSCFSESNYKIIKITFFSLAPVIQTMHYTKFTHTFLIEAANLSGSVLYRYIYLILGGQAK